MVNLTNNAVAMLYNKQMPDGFEPWLQIIDTKKIKPASGTGGDRYRCVLLRSFAVRGCGCCSARFLSNHSCVRYGGPLSSHEQHCALGRHVVHQRHARNATGAGASTVVYLVMYRGVRVVCGCN